ncbi:modulator of macroautophagy TMEM150B-like [Bombina bombina]|uniref:modulator of macroautophagy TMEM150B-like n=1 Tax=Bombina bombina TaxID=8345 RepID=UPI00235A9A21|nr:modulator of macroautophagy TMEM150B-like [Bombina bombina]
MSVRLNIMWIWYLMPICLTIWFTVGIWIVYAIAVTNGSVDITAGVPYISICGAFPPQSCLFGQVLNIGAFFAAWIVVLRFQQLRDYGYNSHLNSASLVMGCLCALGTSIAGNVQISVQEEAHLVGAFLVFVAGNVYFWMQSVLTYKVKSSHDGHWVAPTRFLLSAACTALIVIMVVFFTENMKSASAICEWIVAMIIFVLIGLFSVEFWHFDTVTLHVLKRKITIPNEMQVSTIALY